MAAATAGTGDRSVQARGRGCRWRGESRPPPPRRFRRRRSRRCQDGAEQQRAAEREAHREHAEPGDREDRQRHHHGQQQADRGPRPAADVALDGQPGGEHRDDQRQLRAGRRSRTARTAAVPGASPISAPISAAIPMPDIRRQRSLVQGRSSSRATTAGAAGSLVELARAGGFGSGAVGRRSVFGAGPQDARGEAVGDG